MDYRASQFFFVFLEDTRLDKKDDLFKRIPDFVPTLVIGTLVLTTLMFFPIWWWQWSSPCNYWKTEIVYPLLALGLKCFVGVVMLENVFTIDGGLHAALSLD